MSRSIPCALTALCAFALLNSQSRAQQQSPAGAFEQNTYVYEPWIKGKFSEVVTVKNPGKWIFLAGIGPESEGDGKILFPGDFYRQCKYAYYRIKKLLALHGATLKNVVFVTTYMMDIRHIGASGKCRTEEFAEAGAELPPGASVGVNAFAWPDMLLEIAATAAVEK
jgi:enamine deaminase RidA (YjgF/YER057c/UK114 family)